MISYGVIVCAATLFIALQKRDYNFIVIFY